MKRISVDEVKAAYQKTGYMVLRHGYELQHETGLATCPLMTLACLKRNDGGEPISAGDIKDALDLEHDYVEGFIQGFDEGFTQQTRRYRRNREAYSGRDAARTFLLGVRDGVRVPRHVDVDIDRDGEELPF